MILRIKKRPQARTITQISDLDFRDPFGSGFLHLIPTYPSVRFRDDPDVVERVPLTVLGSLLGLNSTQQVNALRDHDSRLTSRLRVQTIFYWASVISTMALVVVLTLVMAEDANAERGIQGAVNTFFESMSQPVVWGPTYALIVLVAVSALKIGSVLTDKRYADSLAVASLINLLLDLSRPDALSIIATRRAVIARIDIFSRTTTLLALRYSSRDANVADWVRQHFLALDQFIRERERWAIAPLSDTQSVLFSDFHSLIPMVVVGEYGSYQWGSTPPSIHRPDQPAMIHRIVLGTTRVLGFGIPLLFMGYLLYHPNHMNTLEINANVVGLIFIAWLLLAFDALLRLGIVASIISLAKGIKELK